MLKRGTPYILAVLLTLLLILPARGAAAGPYDPRLKYQTIDTVHFAIHYPKYLEDVAQRVAVIAEEAYQILSPKYEWVPWGRTQLLLTDESDFPSGMATVIPYNWLFIRVSAADANSSLGMYDDWLRMLVIHEYTHIMHLDQHRGIWTPLRYILGKTVSPNGMTPGWVKEGLAAHEETVNTKGGRGRASYSEMLIRTAVLEDEFLTIDLADGDQWRWPAVYARYIYGVKFLEYLADTYGQGKLYEFVERVSGSPFLTGINRQARWVFSDIEFESYKVGNRYAKRKEPGTPTSKTFYKLWKEWHEYLKKKYAAEADEIKKEGLTPLETVISSKKAQHASPAVSPDGTKIVYSAFSPYGESQVMIADIDGSNARRLLKKTYTPQISFSGGGEFIVYSKAARYKNYQFIYDLYKYDIGKKKLKRLTNGKRATDPDVSRDGKEVVCVTQNAGTSRLEILNIEEDGEKDANAADKEKGQKQKKELRPIPNSYPQFTQFSNPRFSPDGSRIAVAVALPGSIWDIFIFDKGGREIARVTEDLYVDRDPAWSPDGRYLYFVSDRTDIPNVYKYDLKSGKTGRVTNVLTGVSSPVPTPDGNGLIVRYYTSHGFDIRKAQLYLGYRPQTTNHRPQTAYQASRTQHPASDTQYPGLSSTLPYAETEATEGTTYGSAFRFNSKKYSPLGKALLLPRFVLPNLVVLDDAFIFEAMTGAADPLRWHNWMGGGSYRTDAKYFGYFFSYWYNRFKPVIDVGVMDYAVEFGYITFNYDDDGDGDADRQRTVHLFEKRLRGYGGIAIPFNRQIASLKYFYEDREAKTSLSAAEKRVLNLGVYAGFTLFWGYNDSKEYAASISRQGGRRIRLNFTVTNSIFGSDQRNEQYIVIGDWREYIKTFGRQVLALRATGGMTWGDELVQGTFSLGGSQGEGTLAGSGSMYYFALRGLPVSVLSRDRAMLLSGEYRFPLISVQRGFGTAPFFVNDLYVALFADYGNTWDASQSTGSYFFNNFFLGTGVELRGNFVIGYGLPLIGRIGYGIIVLNRDRLGTLKDPITSQSVRNGIVILQFGTSF